MALGDAGDGGGTPPIVPPTTPPPTDPFADWYKNTIQAHPETYDPAKFTQGQAQAWFPLWDPTSKGFKSSKVDVNGNPIAGNTYGSPDECPSGMMAYGINQCVPQGYHGQGGGGGGGGPFGQGYQFGNGLATPQLHLPPVPTFNAPTGVSELNDPGYQFRLDQGRQAYEASAAAKGTLNSGGTLEDLLKYGQNYATNEYQNVWQRAKDAYAPKFAEWQAQVGGAQSQFAQAGQQWQSEFQQAWDAYQFKINDEFRREQMLYTTPPPPNA